MFNSLSNALNTVYIHDITDLFALVFFMFTLRPHPPIALYETINIDTIYIGMSDEERE